MNKVETNYSDSENEMTWIALLLSKFGNVINLRNTIIVDTDTETYGSCDSDDGELGR